jgi:hypothetical protein
MQKDNSTFQQKAALRRAVLAEVKEPIVMETHGGIGAVYRACYSRVTHGIVFETNERKAGVLAGQRPTWSVYQSDCTKALAAGAGAHLEVNVLDLDPYGEPWPTVAAFFGSERPRASSLWIVVNDGLRQKVRMGGAGKVGSLQKMVQKYGNNLHDIYLDICKELLSDHAKAAGYAIRRFRGYYTGHAQQMTHYAALLEQA